MLSLLSGHGQRSLSQQKARRLCILMGVCLARPVSLNPPMDFQIDLVSDVTCLNTVQAVLAVARILL